MTFERLSINAPIRAYICFIFNELSLASGGYAPRTPSVTRGGLRPSHPPIH